MSTSAQAVGEVEADAGGNKGHDLGMLWTERDRQRHQTQSKCLYGPRRSLAAAQTVDASEPISSPQGRDYVVQVSTV